MLVRPMREVDVEPLERLSGLSYGDERDEVRRRQWIARTRHLLATDGRGCWVAEHDGELAGFAASLRRDLLWVLCSYAVRPDLQGRGTGRALLDAAGGHARGCLRAMLSCSDDPRAYRLYRRAGFSLHPSMQLTGTVDRGVLPVVEHVREGTAADFDLMDSLDRRLRDAAHGPDHPVLASMFRLLVSDRASGSGYAYVDDTGAPVLVAATDRRTATRLTWEALASSTPGSPVAVRHVTAANEWAVDVGLEARLSVSTQGYLGVRGMRPPAPYLHHGSLL